MPAVASTQSGFGKILDEIARAGGPLADAIVTTSPDVTVSTNLGPWVNRRGLFARDSLADTFREERIASTQKWDFGPKGQHIELGIAEMNLFILLSALGPVATRCSAGASSRSARSTIPFIQRGLDALNYACYQDARFLLVATPSGITLAPEGGAHQSIGTPLIGMAQDGLAAFEPAFVDELAVIMRFAFDYMQRGGESEPSERTWLRDETGGSVYLRLSTRPVEQIKREMTADLERDILDGAYWMRRPGPNAEVVVVYTGTVAPGGDRGGRADGRGPPRRRPARRHLRRPAERRLDRGSAGARARPAACAEPHRAAVRRPAASLQSRHRARRPPGDAGLARRGGRATGHARSGVEHFGQTGTIPDLYRHYGIDAQAIIAAAEAIAPARPIRYLQRTA